MNKPDITKSAESFVAHLRMGKGFDDALYHELLASLRSFHSRWHESETIPKSQVVPLIDMPRMVESCAELYGESERKRIVDASHELVDVILEGF